MSHRYLSLATIARFEPLAKKRGVSEVARGPRGFLPVYKRAGSSAKVDEYWRNRREAFIARHMAQVEQRNEPLWDRDGLPSRRHLALIMWAYSPDADRLSAVNLSPSRSHATVKTPRQLDADIREVIGKGTRP
jgi:hypothetical protein